MKKKNKQKKKKKINKKNKVKKQENIKLDKNVKKDENTKKEIEEDKIKKEVVDENVKKKFKLNIKEIIGNIIVVLISVIFTWIVYSLNITVEVMNIKTVIVCFVSMYIFLFNMYIIVKHMNKDSIFIIIKILFPVIITVYATVINNNILYLICGLSEILCIYLITNLLRSKFKIISNILNGVFYFLYNFQVMLFILANNFLTLVMLQNLTSIDGISGNIFKYAFAFIVVTVASCLPIKRIEISKRVNVFFIVVNILVLIFTCTVIKKYYSPFRNFKVLYDSYVSYNEEMNKFEEMNVSRDEFYKEGVGNYYPKNASLIEKPNVIVFFTEGLSQHVIDDERAFMPNIKKYQDMSMNFNNYYNHTFATYRGISGQLYSSFQYNNTDVNKLISIQSIMEDEGYITEFLNTEPNNIEFRAYIKNLGFMKNYNEWEILNGSNKSTADKDAYEKIFEKAIGYNNNNETFFLSCYTYGTHVTFDGIYYKETNNNIINKFTELDNAFGEFMEKFENSPLYDNTIIVFTTDHATYSDSDFKKTFPEAKKGVGQIDTVPLFIYHKGVEVRDIEVASRTTLNFAPTILDYLDISKPNYFLGDSLFSGSEGGTRYDRIHFDALTLIGIKDGFLYSEKQHSDLNLREDILRHIALYKTIENEK